MHARANIRMNLRRIAGPQYITVSATVPCPPRDSHIGRRCPFAASCISARGQCHTGLQNEQWMSHCAHNIKRQTPSRRSKQGQEWPNGRPGISGEPRARASLKTYGKWLYTTPFGPAGGKRMPIFQKHWLPVCDWSKAQMALQRI